MKKDLSDGKQTGPIIALTSYRCAAHARTEPKKTRCPACRVLWNISALIGTGALLYNSTPVPANKRVKRK